ncbi:MAG: ATP-dependent acyl-CoA ligase [Thermoleophilia bacterium]|nr:ATP-dependent acyl-CoA ligase [Thermoleophilia bacterium]
MSEWSNWYATEDPTRWVLPTILRERAAAHPDRPYIRCGEGDWVTYGEIDARTDRIATALIRRGLRAGECVSTLMPNSVDQVALWFGILRAGGVQSPINLAYRGDFLSWVINLPQSRFLVISDDLLDRLDHVAGDLPVLEHVFVWDSGARRGPDPRVAHEPFAVLDDAPNTDPGVAVTWVDDARIMFTSGTTGRSKGVIKQHASDYFSGRTYNEVCGVTEDDTVYTCLPLFHSNAQVLGCYPAMIAGARIQISARYSSTNFWREVTECGATILNTVSAMNYFIWNTPPGEYDRAHSVTRIMAMPAPKDIYHDFRERFGIRWHEGYGLTETGMVTYVPPGVERPGSCGMASPGFEVTVVEPGTDRPVPTGTAGEIVVDMKLPNIVMRAYAGMPEKTAEDFRNLKLHTGDLGQMDAEGYLYFLDRIKDYIRRRGENVSSMEVERVVASHPGVLEAAAVGVVADEGVGSEQEILICVVPRGEAPDPYELLTYCTDKMPYFAVPRYVRFLEHLPKTPTERVRKVELREMGGGDGVYDRVRSGPEIKA